MRHGRVMSHELQNMKSFLKSYIRPPNSRVMTAASLRAIATFAHHVYLSRTQGSHHVRRKTNLSALRLSNDCLTTVSAISIQYSNVRDEPTDTLTFLYRTRHRSSSASLDKKSLVNRHICTQFSKRSQLSCYIMRES